MIIQKITRKALFNLHYKVWALFTALIWWYCIHNIYRSTISTTIPLDNLSISLEEKSLEIQLELNKFSYYAGYYSETNFFLDKKPIHDIITIEKYMILTHPAVKVVAFYPTVVHVKKICRSFDEESFE
jgi:hypothetical protein